MYGISQHIEQHTKQQKHHVSLIHTKSAKEILTSNKCSH